MKKTQKKIRLFPLAVKAEKALRKAVEKVILEHQRTGDPLIIWEKGRVVRASPYRFKVRAK
jgi:hypothetical protein